MPRNQNEYTKKYPVKDQSHPLCLSCTDSKLRQMSPDLTIYL